MAGNFGYEVEVTVGTAGIDAFIQKMRGLVQSAGSFGTSFSLPSGVSATGPGFSGGAGTLGNPAQAVGFSTALQASALSALSSARQVGSISPADYDRGRRQIAEITEALVAGARRFEAIMGKATGQTASGLIVPQAELDRQLEEGRRAGSVVVAQGLKGFDANKANEDKKLKDAEKSSANVAERALKARQKELDELEERLAILGTQTSIDRRVSRAKAEVLVAEQQQARAERAQAAQVFNEARAQGFYNVGTRAQRVQAAVKSRDGNLVDPLGEKTIGGLIAQRTIQASSFAVGGLAFYGALQVLRDTLQESEALEREFAVIEGQIERTFGERSEQALREFKDSVRTISLETGALASEVALVQRQLSAAFVPTEADPGESQAEFQRRQDAGAALAGQNAELAFKFAEVTGLDSKEITDSLTAIGLSFDELNGDFTPILDRAVALEEEFGVLGGQIITFTADLAPLAANLGFSAQQLEALGASAQKFSGRSGGQLAEQFGRIFTDLPSKAPELLRIFNETPELAEMSAGLADAFVANNAEQVLEFILRAAQQVRENGLDPRLVQQISEAVAGRREGASFAAILRQPGQLLSALQDTNDDSAGAVEERWLKVRESLSETMQRLRRSVEQLAEALLSAGLVDALTAVATAFTFIATGAEQIIRVFDRLNDASGGLLGQMVGLYAILKSVDLVIKSLGASKVLGLLAPGIAGRLAGLAEVGIAARGVTAAQGALGAVRGVGARAGGGLGLQGILARGEFLAGVAGVGARSALGAFGAGAAGLAGGGSLLTFAPTAGGAIGATAAGIAAPAAATIAAIELYRTNQRVRAAIESQSQDLARIASTAQFGDLLRGFGANDNPEKTAFGIPGTQRLRQAVVGTANRALGADPENVLREQGALRGPEALSAGLAAIDVGELSDASKVRYNKAREELDKALRGEEADLESVVSFMGSVASGNADIANAIGSAVDGYTRVEDASQTAQASAQTLQSVLSAFQNERATPEAVQAALAEVIAPLQTLADAALKAGDYTAYLSNIEQVDALRESANKALSEYAANTIGFAEQINGIFGQSTPESRIETATRILQDPNVTDQDTRLKALQDLATARDEAFQAKLDQARNERERLDILAAGPGVDPIAQAEAIYQQVLQASRAKLARLKEQQAKNQAFYASGQQGPTIYPDASDEIRALENITQEDIAKISEQLVQDIEEYGEGAIRVRLALLRARATEVAAALRALGGGGASDALRAELSAINEQVRIYSGLEASGVNPADLAIDKGGLDPTQELERRKAEATYARDYALAVINRQKAAAAGDPVQLAALSQQAAQVSLNYAREQFGPNSIEAINAEAELAGARIEARSAAKEVALAQIAVAQAAAAGDPVQEAALSIRAAQVAAAYARGPVEALQAQAQLINAINQQQDAYDDIAQAQLELKAAHAARNPLEAARIALQQADLAIKQAKGTAERLRAEAQRVAAQQSLADVIGDIADAQAELAIAIAEAGGDAVEAARLRLKEAFRALGDIKGTGDQAAIARARAEVVGAQRAYQDSILSKQQSDIEFALEMGNITTRQAIESYQQLLTIPTNTEEQNRELQLIIKRLQGELQQDFQFNLPTQLGLPTTYEARRFDQGTGSGGGYNDNRVITVNVQATTGADPQAIAATVAAVIGQPNRTGVIPRRYA